MPNNPKVSCGRCGREAVHVAYLHRHDVPCGPAVETRRMGALCEACERALAATAELTPTLSVELCDLWPTS